MTTLAPPVAESLKAQAEVAAQGLLKEVEENNLDLMKATSIIFVHIVFSWLDSFAFLLAPVSQMRAALLNYGGASSILETGPSKGSSVNARQRK